VASWFETRVAALLTVEELDLILRSGLFGCVSNDEASEKPASFSPLLSLLFVI
jgi:hypothetical protein